MVGGVVGRVGPIRPIEQLKVEAARRRVEARSAKSEDQEKRVIDAAHLVKGQVTNVFAEFASIDSTDHLAENPRGLIADRHVWMKARRAHRLRSRTDDHG